MASTTITDAANTCLASFDAIAQVPVADSPERLHSEDGRSRYHIWASNLGSLHPETDRRSADYRLREAPEVVERIVELLDELTEINSDILEIVSGGRANRQMSESEDELESPDELSELNLSVGDIITSLFRVSMLVKKATTRDRYAKAASAKEAAFLAEFDIRHVADKYPKLRAQPWLLERLGNSITQRRQFLRYCRNHKHRIAHVTPRETLPHELLPMPARTDGNLEIPAHAASTTNTPFTRPTLTPTTTSTLHAGRIAVEDLQNLDRDDAVSQATSVAYSQVDPDDTGVLHVPRLEEVSHVQPFECPFCFGIVQAKRQHSWRKHVLSDLRAYVCISADCDAGLFEDKAAWQAHDAECHQLSWSCNQCRSGPFTSAKSLQDHLRSTHKVGELPDDVIAKLVDASSHSVSEATPSCPFCDFEDDVRNNATAKGQDLLPSAPVVIPLADYHQHLAFHQEQLALFAIPPEIERNVESGSNHGRSNADRQDSVQFMAKWRDLVDITDIDDSPEDGQDEMAPDLGVQMSAEPGPGDDISSTKFDDLDVAKLFSLSKICYTCHHRFTRPADVDRDDCPECGSDSIFADLPWNTNSDIAVGDTTDEREANSSLHPLGITPPQLFDLIDDIDGAVARLQHPTPSYLRKTNDISEAVSQLICLSDGFGRLAKLQNNPEYRLRFQSVQENVHNLCSSVRYTIDAALNALHPPVGQTQWTALSSSMRDIEQTDALERLRWYQAAILGLLEHLDGFPSESLLGVDTNISSLLERQTTKRTLKSLSDPGTPPEIVKPKEETLSINPTDPDHIQPSQATFKRLTTSISRALRNLQNLDIHHSGDATIVPEITKDLRDLLTSFQKLSNLYDDPRYEPRFLEVQESIQVLCRSMQRTVDAILRILTAESLDGETTSMMLTMLDISMSQEKKIGLSKSLRWYSISVLELLNYGWSDTETHFRYESEGDEIA